MDWTEMSEDELSNMATRIRKLEKALEETRDKVCKFYCTWYDKGIPRQDGSATAYDMMCIVRKDTTEALKEGS